ncbi:hypothetical protein [Bacillus tropicus]|uniref:hypothetical protein n=1 Tax=Bacillus tropicus TaxID=2026188 RepID=UPI0034E5B3E5
MVEVICELNKGKIVLNKDKSNFYNVIQSFKTSKKLLVSTYSIDFRLFKDINPDTQLEVVINIPSLDKLWYIDTLKKLHKKFKNISTYISLDNHSKIIITDTVAYVGSANFSKSSYDNFECGVRVDISNAPEIHKLFEELKKDALFYDGTNYKVTRVSIIIQQVNEIKLGLEDFCKDLEYVENMIKTHCNYRDHYRDFKDFESENFEYILASRMEELIDDSFELVHTVEVNEDEFLEDLSEKTVKDTRSLFDSFILEFDKLIEFDIEKYREQIYMKKIHWAKNENELSVEAEELSIEELKEISNICLQELTELTDHLKNNFIPPLEDFISNAEDLEQNAEESYKPTSSSSKYKGKKDQTIEKLKK